MNNYSKITSFFIKRIIDLIIFEKFFINLLYKLQKSIKIYIFFKFINFVQSTTIYILI